MVGGGGDDTRIDRILRVDQRGKRGRALAVLAALARTLAAEGATASAGRGATVAGSDESDESDGDGDSDDGGDGSDDEDGSDGGDGSDGDDGDDGSGETPTRPGPTAVEDEFEAEINKLIAESTEARRKEGGAKPLDVAVPMSMLAGRTGEAEGACVGRARRHDVLIGRAHARTSAHGRPRVADGGKANVDEHGNVMFTLFTRKGNKQQAHALVVPSDTALAVQTRASTLADQQEQAELKRRVLQYERQSEEREYRMRGPGACSGRTAKAGEGAVADHD